MMEEFYSSPAVMHKVDKQNFYNTFDLAVTDNPYVKIYVMENESIIIGYCQISLSYSNEAGGLCVFIEELMIKEEFRNKGYGKEFIDFVFSSYKYAKRFRLEVTKENENAISLYNKMGFDTLSYIQMIIDK